MKNILTACLLFLTTTVTAQRYRHRPVIQEGFYASFSPHSFLEPEQGAIGLGIGFRINDRFELWTEGDYLYKGFPIEGGQLQHLRGFRTISSVKYFYNNRHGFFVGLEFRLKKYSFNDKYDFKNPTTGDSILDYPHTARHTLPGIGAFWGKRFKLTSNGKFELEGVVGIGVKWRTITRTNVPAGYTATDNWYRKNMNPLPDRNIEQALPYVPATFRFIYHF